MLEDEIINNCSKLEILCCACGHKINTRRGLNLAVTNKRATWKCPVFGGFDVPDYPALAVAVICDCCAAGNARIRVCIEFEGGGPVKYHDIDSLEDVSGAECKMKYYFGKKLGMSPAARNKLMLKAARERSVN